MLLILHGELVILEHMHMDLVKLRHIRPMAQIAVTTLSPLRCLSTVLGMGEMSAKLNNQKRKDLPRNKAGLGEKYFYDGLLV